jgi:cell division protein FtsB
MSYKRKDQDNSKLKMQLIIAIIGLIAGASLVTVIIVFEYNWNTSIFLGPSSYQASLNQQIQDQQQQILNLTQQQNTNEETISNLNSNITQLRQEVQFYQQQNIQYVIVTGYLQASNVPIPVQVGFKSISGYECLVPAKLMGNQYMYIAYLKNNDQYVVTVIGPTPNFFGWNYGSPPTNASSLILNSYSQAYTYNIG